MLNEIYRNMYVCLFNRVSDAISVLEQAGENEAKLILVRGQQETEEMYLAAGDEKTGLTVCIESAIIPPKTE